MFILFLLLAFAWVMALNIYVVQYQQHNMALLGYLRQKYPDVYARTKNRLTIGMFAPDRLVRNSILPALTGDSANDRLIEQALFEMSEIRRRGFWTMGVVSGLLIVSGLLAFR